MFINIYISSKNLKSLKLFTSFILKLVNNNKLISKTLIKNFQKKNKQKIFTVLKSPHVNKTAQTQFEYTLYKRQFTIFTNSSFKFIFFLKYFQENIFSDIKIKTKFRTNLKKNTSINFKSFSKSSTSLYLNYLDVLGELKF
uniref:Ribosomal protein S10 n=1 Tax=Eucampia zodiacus TaxID=444606 RepID=A0A7T0GF09_9STRA|nr:ribosomal protein S10 [Eucampia zodiacus]QPJ79925.1 ribosomal protein S10 [Eucampia zodiacus]